MSKFRAESSFASVDYVCEKQMFEESACRKCDKKFLALYALVRFIELKYLSVSHLIELKDIGSVKSMHPWLVVYLRHF